MTTNTSRLPAEFLAERDARVFSLRKTGLSATDIARRLELSTAQVNGAIERQLNRLNRESFLAYPEVLRMELERLDSMQAALWPKTQIRRVELDDGSTAVLEADEKAIETVMRIMGHRAKLLGMDATNINIQSSGGDGAIDVRSTLVGTDNQAHSAEDLIKSEAMELLRLAIDAGMIDEQIGTAMLTSASEHDTVIDAEIIEDDEGGNDQDGEGQS